MQRKIQFLKKILYLKELLKLEITIASKCCLKGTDWKLAFGGSVGIIKKRLACVQPELQASYP